MDPTVNRNNHQNGFILEKELFTPGPATYSPDMKAVYGKSKGYSYREPLRDKILGKVDLLAKRKLAEERKQEEERKRQTNKSNSRSRADSTFTNTKKNSERHPLSRKSQS
jgi:hypothetical protein